MSVEATCALDADIAGIKRELQCHITVNPARPARWWKRRPPTRTGCSFCGRSDTPADQLANGPEVTICGAVRYRWIVGPSQSTISWRPSATHDALAQPLIEKYMPERSTDPQWTPDRVIVELRPDRLLTGR